MFNPKTQHDHNSSPGKNSAEINDDSVDWSSSGDEIWEFRPTNLQELDDSGVCSPPLWRTSPSPNLSPARGPNPSHPFLSHHRLSPNSRRKAIASGQRELMEMVKNMPESSYELSLQDLVEHHLHKTEISNIEGHNVQNMVKGRVLQKRAVLVKVKSYKGLEEKGLFLKMGFPFNFQSKKIKRIGDSNNCSGRVLPKPETDWWKKKFTGSSDSDNSRSSSDSGRRNSSSRRYGGGRQRESEGILIGCLQLFQSRSIKSAD